MLQKVAHRNWSEVDLFNKATVPTVPTAITAPVGHVLAHHLHPLSSSSTRSSAWSNIFEGRGLPTFVLIARSIILPRITFLVDKGQRITHYTMIHNQ